MLTIVHQQWIIHTLAPTAPLQPDEKCIEIEGGVANERDERGIESKTIPQERCEMKKKKIHEMRGKTLGCVGISRFFDTLLLNLFQNLFSKGDALIRGSALRQTPATSG